MKLTTQERMKLHVEFMCAAVTGILARNTAPQNGLSIEQTALRVATSSIGHSVKHWEGEKK